MGPHCMVQIEMRSDEKFLHEATGVMDKALCKGIIKARLSRRSVDHMSYCQY